MRLKLKGELISDEYAELYRCFGFNHGFYCPGDVASAMEQLTPEEELVLEVNSVGGMVDAASEIYAMLEQCPNPTRAEVQSLAASAASYLIMACDRVEMSLPAQLMIHCASWGICGNKHDHSWAAQQLETCDSSILDVYCRKCGGKTQRDTIRELMEKESYLTARDCLSMGLIDGIIGEADENPESAKLVASVANHIVRAMRTLPDIAELMERRSAEQVEARQKLELEKLRYSLN